MEILINTDNNIEGTAEMIAYFKSTIEHDLDRFSDHLTRIEVKISDENGEKSVGDDKRCVMEARLKGMDPIAVTSFESSVEKSVKEATSKMKTSLEKLMGKLRGY